MYLDCILKHLKIQVADFSALIFRALEREEKMRKLNIKEVEELRLAFKALTHTYGEKGVILFYKLFKIIEEITNGGD